MFAYPEQARYGRPIPKSKIFEKSNAPSSLRKRFAAEVDKLVWEYKLAPDTVNLPERGGVLEIQVISVSLKTPRLDPDLLRCLDRTIPHPLFFEVTHAGRFRTVAAFKRPHEANAGDWVVGDYYQSPWRKALSSQAPLPLAIDLFGLYEAMLRALMMPAKTGESLREQAERLSKFRVAQGEIRKLEAKVKREKHFPRQVDLERELRTLRKAWSEELNASGDRTT